MLHISIQESHQMQAVLSFLFLFLPTPQISGIKSLLSNFKFENSFHYLVFLLFLFNTWICAALDITFSSISMTVIENYHTIENYQALHTEILTVTFPSIYLVIRLQIVEIMFNQY